MSDNTRGEFVMIRGPSGGGKTTLLNIIGTIDIPTGGYLGIFIVLSIELLGTRIDATCSDSFLSKMRLENIGIPCGISSGFVFQTFNLLATMTALENVELPMTLLGKLNQKERKKRAIDLLKSMIFA